MIKLQRSLAGIGLSCVFALTALADPAMTGGPTKLASVGPLAFSPEGVLFISDPKGAAIFAVETGDQPAVPAATLAVPAVDEKIAALLGTTRDQIAIVDLAVSPVSHQAYLAVSRGRGPDAIPVIVRAAQDGTLSLLDLNSAPSTRASLPNPPADVAPGEDNRRGNPRMESITDLAYVGGKVIIAGLSNEEFASTLRTIPYPFTAGAAGASVEIYHGSHGRYETNSPIRSFASHKINGETHILAAYTCTPLVTIPTSALTNGAHVKGTTIAELGNRNRPLDMIVYNKQGREYLLMANSSRGVMKMSAEKLGGYAAITAPVPDKQGVPYETLADWNAVTQLALLDDRHALIVSAVDGSPQNLEVRMLP